MRQEKINGIHEHQQLIADLRAENERLRATLGVQQPLTERQINAVGSLVAQIADMASPQGWLKFARAIEAAHGIRTASTTGDYHA